MGETNAPLRQPGAITRRCSKTMTVPPGCFSECARRIDQKLPLFDPINDPATYAVTLAEVPGALHNLADAAGAAEALAAFEGTGSRARRVAGRPHCEESRVRLLESELARLTDRLQRVEGLLATAAPAPAAPTPATITGGAPAPTAVGAGAPSGRHWPTGRGERSRSSGRWWRGCCFPRNVCRRVGRCRPHR